MRLFKKRGGFVKSICEEIKINSEKYPSKTAVVYNDVAISYGDFYKKALCFAGNLKKCNLKKGNRVVLESNNLICYFAAFLGCQLAGCTVVPIEENISIYKLQDILKATKPTLIFMKNNGEAYEKFFEPCENTSFRAPKDENIASIIATTGTTGDSVLVVHNNKSEAATVENLIWGIDLNEDDVVFSHLPCYLAVGIRRFFAGLAVGATVVLNDGELEENEIVRSINEYGVNHICLGNSNLKVLLDSSNYLLKEAMEKVESVESLSGPLTGVNIRDFHRNYPHTTLYNVYGTTESGCLLINNTKDNPLEGCLGKPACNSQVFLVDENGEKVEKFGVYGHIAVKGNTNMTGYYRKKILTERVMPDDYIVINDIAYFDSDGYFYFVGRVGDIIDVRGNKIIPAEIEKIAKAFSGIKDCALVSSEGHREIPVPVLFVSVEKGFDLKHFEDYLKKNLEMYKIPEKIIQIEKIPRTPTGKILRKALEMNKI